MSVYKLPYTGEEIEALLEKLSNAKNFTFLYDDLEHNVIGIEIGDDIYIFNTISAEADGDSNYLKSITINGVTYDVAEIPEVKFIEDEDFLPIGIKIGEKYYYFPKITANPFGTPTETLKTILINGTIYKLYDEYDGSVSVS